MLFHSPIFLAFFVIVFSLHWTFKSNEWRKILLVAASYVFYAFWDWRFLFLLLFSTVLDYSLACLMEQSQSPKKRRILLTLSLIGNLGVLGFFKYFNFFIQSFVALANKMGVSINYEIISIILPVGISFYTFQTLSYTIDVYLRKLPAEKNLINLALFVAFFPQLVAGPIVHAKDFLPYINCPKFLKDIPWRACILLFMFGLIKKVVVADNMGAIVDQIFGHANLYSSWTVIFGVVLFAIQIYCDFSGYSDMAIALSRVFGFNLPLNFAWPYFAANLSEFWRRWHISLSTWWRDYLYIPLGGNRNGELTQDRNLFITMAVAGLWHGAAWTFIIWGAIHGLGLIAYHRTKKTLIIWNRMLTVWTLKPQLWSRIRQVSSLMIAFWFVGLCMNYGNSEKPIFVESDHYFKISEFLFFGTLATYFIVPLKKIKKHLTNNILSWRMISRYFIVIKKVLTESRIGKKLFHIASIVLTFWFVCLCWIYFRAENAHAAFTIVKKYLLITPDGKSLFSLGHYLGVLVLILCHYFTYLFQPVHNAEKIPTLWFSVIVGGLFALFLIGQPIKALPFIYFQF